MLKLSTTNFTLSIFEYPNPCSVVVWFIKLSQVSYLGCLVKLKGHGYSSFSFLTGCLLDGGDNLLSQVTLKGSFLCCFNTLKGFQPLPIIAKKLHHRGLTEYTSEYTRVTVIAAHKK